MADMGKELPGDNLIEEANPQQAHEIIHTSSPHTCITALPAVSFRIWQADESLKLWKHSFTRARVSLVRP
jgi:hypothetical protein